MWPSRCRSRCSSSMRSSARCRRRSPRQRCWSGARAVAHLLHHHAANGRAWHGVGRYPWNFLGLWNQFLLPIALNASTANYVLSQGMASFASQAGCAVNFGALFAAVVITVLPAPVTYARRPSSARSAGFGVAQHAQIAPRPGAGADGARLILPCDGASVAEDIGRAALEDADRLLGWWERNRGNEPLAGCRQRLLSVPPKSVAISSTIARPRPAPSPVLGPPQKPPAKLRGHRGRYATAGVGDHELDRFTSTTTRTVASPIAGQRRDGVVDQVSDKLA